MSLDEIRKVPDFIFPDWQVDAKVVALTTTRKLGSSRGHFEGLNIATHVGDDIECVIRNRDLLLEKLDDNVHMQWLEQVHGTDIVEARKGIEVITADACYTSQPGIACCVTTADCLPVLITNKAGDMVAGVHAGWRGLSAGILERTLEKFSCSSRDIFVWLGPAIGPCHFEVGADVKEAYLTSASKEIVLMLGECFVPTEIPGKFMANLYGLAKIKLNQLGVKNISGGEFCTFCEENDFYSYRRQAKTGRMVSLTYIKP